MRRFIVLFFIVQCLLLKAIGQTPHAFKYQAVARDATGNLLTEKKISVRISILQGSDTGKELYSEIHTPTTNKSGLFNLDIGLGKLPSGSIANIDWSSSTYYVKIEIDVSGGIDFQLIGSAQLLSVPYALYAEKSGNPGITGPTGPIGATGATGPAGLNGATGAKGESAKILLYSQQQIDTLSTSTGMIVFNTTTAHLNYWNGHNWEEINSSCTPHASIAKAGDDQTVVSPAVSTSLAANVPLFGKGIWKIVSGSGGTIAQPNNPASIFYGLTGNDYVLRWTIKTLCDSTSDEVSVSFIKECKTAIDLVANVTYKAVQIGKQCWMAENLNANRFNNSEYVSFNQQQSFCNVNAAAYCNYNDDASIATIYGRLYNWYAASDSRNICPKGWHVPSQTEWTQLSDFLGGADVAGGKLKEIGTSHWVNNTGADNSSDFTALPGGSNTCAMNGAYWSSGLGYGAHWWSSTDSYEVHITGSDTTFSSCACNDNYGYNIRCVRD